MLFQSAHMLTLVLSVATWSATALAAQGPTARDVDLEQAPEPARIDPARLQRLIDRGRATHSDAVIVIQDGRTIVEEYYGKPRGPVYIASAGKSLTALAVGKLIDQRRIKSLDQPVSDFYPQWLQGEKKKVTVRMLLNHTSGLQNVPNASVEIERKNPPVDVVELALAAELTHAPGVVFSYNNKAVGLLAGVIQRASGKRMDVYFADEFYRPMGIEGFSWVWDEAGNPLAYGGHLIEPIGLAKFGQLMLGGGMYDGQQLVSRRFVEAAVRPGQELFPACGLLWWRYPASTTSLIEADTIARMKKDGVDADFVGRVTPLAGKEFASDEEYAAALVAALGTDWRSVTREALADVDYGLRRRIFGEETVGYYASGSRGNYLLVVPRDRLVAVRVVGNTADYDWDTDGFGEFLELAAELTGRDMPAPPFR